MTKTPSPEKEYEFHCPSCNDFEKGFDEGIKQGKAQADEHFLERLGWALDKAREKEQNRILKIIEEWWVSADIPLCYTDDKKELISEIKEIK